MNSPRPLSKSPINGKHMGLPMGKPTESPDYHYSLGGASKAQAPPTRS